MRWPKILKELRQMSVMLLTICICSKKDLTIEIRLKEVLKEVEDLVHLVEREFSLSNQRVHSI